MYPRSPERAPPTRASAAPLAALRRLTVGADTLLMQLHASADALEPARQSMLRHLSSDAVDAATVYRCELVLEEVLLNIVRHGRPDPAGTGVEVGITLRPDTVTLRFTDDGPAFDPTSQPAPELPTAIEQASPGGLGLLLVRRLSRQLNYRRDGAFNRLEVVVARAGGRAAAT